MNSAFSFESPDDSPGFLLWQTFIIWQGQVKSLLLKYDISHAQFVILANLLWFHENKRTITQAELVKSTKLDKMTISKSLRKLTTIKLLNRADSTYDTRVKDVFLTKSGAKLIKKLIPLVEEIDSQFFSKLDSKENKKLLSIFKKLIS